MRRLRKLLFSLFIFLIAALFFAGIAVYYAASPNSLSIFSKSEGIIHLSHIPESNSEEFNRKLHLVTYNIGYASGLENNQALHWTRTEIENNLHLMAQTLKAANPDLILLQEVDFAARRTFKINQMEFLAKELQLPYMAYVITWNKRYLPWPYGLPSKNYGQMVSGQAILSRYPILKQETLRFEKPSRNPFWYNWFYLDRIAQRIEVEMPNKENFVFYNIHLEAFDSDTRLLQAQRLGQWIEKDSHPFLWAAGDFNSSSVSLVELPKESSQALQVFAQETGLENAESKIPFYTMPSDHPERKIDHIFYRPGKINPSTLRLKSRSMLRVDTERRLNPSLKAGVWRSRSIKLEKVQNFLLTASDHLPVSAIFLF